MDICVRSASTENIGKISKYDDITMIPVAQCVATVDQDTLQSTSAREDTLPVAECVDTIHEIPTPKPNKSSEIQIEVLTDEDESFNTPSAQSFVTEENEEVNASVFDTITGHELLARLKEHRKKATARSAMVGGIIGLFFLGPIGALGGGLGAAIVTKNRLKRKEKSIRLHLNGRLDQPLRVLSRSIDCRHHW